MNITELANTVSTSQNEREITLDGFFVMAHGIGYFVSNRENKDNKAQAILVEHANLEECLLSSVPANGGSKYSYCSKARISSTFMPTTDTEFIGKIVNIKDFIVYIFDEPMSVAL